MTPRGWIRWLAPPALVLPGALPAYAVQYLSLEQAQRLCFPDAAEFLPAHVSLSPEQVKAVERASRTRVRQARQQVWKAVAGTNLLGYFLLDEVYGKHEFITYAVALGPAGQVRQVEILEYRETYGDEIKSPQWRAQFVGKRQGDAVELDKDIRNISGATLSCRHVTDGVRRLLATFAVALRP